TGLMLIALSPLIPESARFLQYMGRMGEARATLARFGITSATQRVESAVADHSHLPVFAIRGFLGASVALTLAALTWGFVNFGVLLWLPSALVAEGRSVGLASAVIARSTLIAAPTVVVTAYLYSVWSTKWSLITAIGITTLGLVAVMLHGMGSLS